MLLTKSLLLHTIDNDSDRVLCPAPFLEATKTPVENRSILFFLLCPFSSTFVVLLFFLSLFLCSCCAPHLQESFLSESMPTNLTLTTHWVLGPVACLRFLSALHNSLLCSVPVYKPFWYPTILASLDQSQSKDTHAPNIAQGMSGRRHIL